MGSDKPDRQLIAERYEMLITHAIKHNMSFKVLDEDPEFYLFEVTCMDEECGWWDHWDERKEDWPQATTSTPEQH